MAIISRNFLSYFHKKMIMIFLLTYLGGPYSGFSGRDASRGLATFNVNAITDEYDDLSDLKPSEIEQVILLSFL